MTPVAASKLSDGDALHTVVGQFSRRAVGAFRHLLCKCLPGMGSMTVKPVTYELMMAIWRRGKLDALLHRSDRGNLGGRTLGADQLCLEPPRLVALWLTAHSCIRPIR